MSTTSPHTAFSDPQAFKQVYTRHWKQVYAVCYSHLKEVDTAQEMVQDIFLSLWERRQTLIITTSLEHYLVRAAKMKVLEHFRNQTIRSNYVPDVPESSEATEREIEYNSLHENLERLLGQQPDQSRQVFSLRQQGMSNREIASKLGFSEKAVEYHVTRVLRFLRERLHLVLDR